MTGLDRQLVRQTGEAAIQQPVQALLAQVRHLGEGDGERVELKAERLGVEVAARVEALGLVTVAGEVQRAVGDRPELAGQLGPDVVEKIGDRTVHLRQDAEGDWSLPRSAQASRSAPSVSAARRAWIRSLSRVALQPADARRVGPHRGPRQDGRQRARERRVLEQGVAALEQPRRRGRRERRAVDERDPLLGLRHVGRHSTARERPAGVHRFAVLDHRARAREGLKEVAERDDLARARDPAGGDPGRPAVVEPVGDEAAQVRRDGRPAGQEAVEAQQHRAPYDRGRRTAAVARCRASTRPAGTPAGARARSAAPPGSRARS